MHNAMMATKTSEWRLEFGTKKLSHHMRCYASRPSNTRHAKIKKWTAFTAHAVFEMHPELREDGSLPRYFVAKAGRKQGIYGAALTEFVESKYQDGTWWRLVPEEVLLGKLKTA